MNGPVSARRELRHVAVVVALLVAACTVSWLIGAVATQVPLPAWLQLLAVTFFIGPGALVVVESRRARAETDASNERVADLERQLGCDTLTGLMNRTAFNSALDSLAEMPSPPNTIMVLFFDLDRFKEVNDTLGHKVGDQLLMEVSSRAAERCADAIAIARLGGDEFAAILPTTGSAAAQAFGDAIVEAMAEPFEIDHHSINVAASVGIAIGDPMLDDVHELLRRADSAMYEAKGAARGRCHIFDDMLSGRQLQESFVRIELGKSLAEGTFNLHFQPIFDARTGGINSVEALLRATAPSLQGVDTATLISVAEKTGQIVPLTDWTMDVAFAAIRTLGTMPVGLNISPVYFRQPQFVHLMIDRLLETRTPPELLTVEITEGVLIADIDAAREAITRLREIGVKVYLDDFGTCYSSLSYLQHFELDALKLDKSFLRNISDRKKATQVIKSMIDFGHSLDMRVVVEGVESDWQARLLQLLGCDLLQGYALGAPVPLEQIQALRERPGSPLPVAGAEDAEPSGLRASSKAP